VAAQGGPPEVPFVGERHQVAEVAEIHGLIIVRESDRLPL
jgi:hypothetical protein